ncbi:MAG TPA: hypothetical protein DCM05_08360 [Elusimicrobia bacterium]|nr:hypothetical protein [Elusimicrobiota bacterium]
MRPLILLAVLAALPLSASAKPEEGGGASASANNKPPSLESLFLDYSHTQLGAVSKNEAKKKYLYTIQLEKSRMMHRLLRTVYENAFDLYKQGDFDGSRDITAKILAMDPSFQDAAILHRASIELNGSARPGASERSLVENRFEEGMALYRQGRLVEASDRWEESVKLSPGNLKARYWLKRVRGELADEHFRRGQKAYQMHRLRDALDQWYSALVLNPKFPQLVGNISKVESELRRQEANDKLQEALNLYGQGRNDQALKLLDEVLTIEPGETKAQKLIGEIRLEIANQYVTEGRSKYKGRQYKPAIDAFNKAVDYGYDPRKANHLIALAKEQMNKEADARRKRVEDERRRQEEEEARRKAEELRKQKEAEDAAQAKQQQEKQQQSQLDANPPAEQPAGPAPNSEENKRNAIKHWQQGLQAFQRSDYQKARDEWMLCKQFDPANSDCIAGLQRIDNTYGGGQ